MPSSPHAADAVDRTVLRAQHHARLQLAIRAAGWGITAALSGLVLLLIAGYHWLPLTIASLGSLAGIVLAIAIWRNEQTSNYEIARQLDRDWGTEDQVSTACYFADQEIPDARGIQAQRDLAVSVAERREADISFGFRFPLAAWCALATLFAVIALFGIRYSFSSQLALESSLPSLVTGGDAAANLAARTERDSAASERNANGRIATDADELAEARTPSEEPSLNVEADALSRQDEGSSLLGVEGLEQPSQAGDELSFEQPGGSEGGNQKQGQQGEQNSPAEKGSNLESPGDPSEGEDASGDWRQQSNSLLDRLKDAIKQLRENMNSEPPQTAQDGAPQQEGASTEDPSPSGDQSGAQAADGQAAPAEASMESEEVQPDGPQQAAQGSGTKSGSGSKGEGESAGAAGDGEGSKEIEQRATEEVAFAALEEFYLQRAEELSGEVLMETNTSEKFSAMTPYRLQERGRIDDSGLTLRDEAPASYQAFVENYFKQIRSKED